LFDIIGDIHGYATELKKLLSDLGYEKQEDCYRHPKHKVIFLGDYIDRGDEIVETLKIVRGMVEHGQALALMGNHEYNFICYHTGEDGAYLREHSEKNTDQVKETNHQMDQTGESIAYWKNWFMSLPLIIDLPRLRAVHACWDADQILLLKKKLGAEYTLTPDFLLKSAQDGSPEFILIETLLKGVEAELPNGAFYLDKDGNDRHKARMKWWEKGCPGQSYSELAIIPEGPGADLLREQLCQIICPEKNLPKGYAADEPPVFFGHYWFRGALPAWITALQKADSWLPINGEVRRH